MNHPFRSQYQYDRTPSRRRVVITGLGAVSAAGVGVKPLWESLLAGRGSVGEVTLYKSEGMPVSIAGEVRNFDPTRYIAPALKPKRMARHTQFAVVAAQEALADARLNEAALKDHRVAVVVGSSTGTSEVLERAARDLDRTGPRAISASTAAIANMQGAPSAVAAMLGGRQIPATSVTNTCSSGVDAISIAADLIRLGRRDVLIAGGADAPLSDVMSTVISNSGIGTPRGNVPAAAGRPFDRERAGGVLGEGAGIFVLEEMEAARTRGAKIYAEISGIHSCPDTDRDRPTSGLEYTMRGALENAGCSAPDIDFISAWGCGSPVADLCETEAIKAVLGPDAYRVAVGSIKGAIGIPLGAAGALQLVTTALSHVHNILPPTINCDYADLDCDLDYISGRARKVRIRHSLLNAHGMTGGNVTLLLSSIR